MWKIFLISFSLAFGLSPASWIGDSLSKIGNLTLQNLTMPGTHDSGSYYLTTVPMPGDTSALWEELYKLAEKTDSDVGKIAIDWGRSQDENFYNQMQGGIRYFDLRAGWNKSTSTWVTFHFCEGYPVQYLLQNISQYLQAYPKEIVIVEVSHFDGSPTNADITSLRNMILSILGNYLYSVDLTFSFTINQMVSSGKRVLLTMEQGYDNAVIWPPNAIYNTYADTSDLSTMIAFNNLTVNKFMNSSWAGQLFKVSWTLTPDDHTIIDSIIPFHPHSLIELADEANKALPSFWTNMKKYGWKTGNILIIDHFEKSDIMSVVWAMNGLS